MTLPDHCWIMMTTTVMMTPADGFQNNFEVLKHWEVLISTCEILKSSTWRSMIFWIWGGCCWNWRDRWDWLATLSMLMMKVQSDDSDLQTGVLTVGHHCLLLFISQPDKCMGICYWSFRKLFVRTRSTLIVSNLNAMKKTEWLTDFNHDEKALLASWLSILDLRRNCYSSDSSVFRSWSLLLCYSESESSTSICLENHLDMYW
jgi:hypothetical protein